MRAFLVKNPPNRTTRKVKNIEKMEHSIGIDLGGTDIKAGLVSSVGDISCRVVVPTDVETGGPKVVASRIAEAVRQVLVKVETQDGNSHQQELTATLANSRQFPTVSDSHSCEIGVGLGSPGLIIAETGVVHFSPNFPGWSDIPLVTYVNAELAKLQPFKKYKPILRGMDNDVNAMTLGELHHGAGVGYKNLVALTLGTGVGGGVVIDGEVYHGSQNTAGELGHTVVNPNGRYCGCGNQGCLEAYAGAKNIVERTQEKITTGRSTTLATATNAGTPLTPRLIAEAAQAGDELAIEIFAETGRYIGIALTSIAHILNPQIAIIGGGIAAAGEKLLFEPIRTELSKRAMDIPAQMKIVKAHLGNDAGIVGAAMLALEGSFK
ncbi:ROK family protein [Candidatus Poribacteria bacterium]|nr:ROK family protein [Candidatus Poribacteria bacterium]MYG05102.1 ROK family protein [Candidatus Poribacteria bacterium]MYK21885.1 ROK family protein [Candidatus Poribacteria bacterium]